MHFGKGSFYPHTYTHTYAYSYPQADSRSDYSSHRNLGYTNKDQYKYEYKLRSIK